MDRWMFDRPLTEESLQSRPQISLCTCHLVECYADYVASYKRNETKRYRPVRLTVLTQSVETSLVEIINLATLVLSHLS